MKSTPFSVKATEQLPAPDTAFLFHSKRTWVMGVLNATPDSFFAPSRGSTLNTSLALAERFVAEKVDIIDIGGESTRPGAPSVPVEEELARALPVVEALRARFPGLPLSIDTQKADVARRALSAGVTLVNDISALRYDDHMADVIAEAQCPVVLMHMQGSPVTMQTNPAYDDVVEDVKRFFAERIAAAMRAGISEEKIILDPGIGFGKTLAHNLALLKNLFAFRSLGRPLLVGVSRKSFIGRLLGTADQPTPAEDRLAGSLATGLWAAQSGANGLRVHDVGATRSALSLWEAVQTS